MSSSLAESVGQLIIGKVPGTELDDGSKDCLKKGTISGVTIFKENVQSQEQLLNLCDSVRRFSYHPSYIMVDQEGGAVQRLDDVISPLPSMMAMGKLNDPERLKLIIAVSGKQLSLLGINCVLAPVLDVNTNPANPIIGTRALGEDVEKVAELGAVIIRSYLEAGVLPVAKHFPGHGDTDLDSHLALPKLSFDLERLERVELSPFRENLLLTPAILVAHLWIECLDKELLPASLSARVSTQLLKEEMGFQRLLVSDDMLMKAITSNWGLEEACVRAVAAGLDLLLVCSGPNDARSVHAAIVKAVESGRISEDRLASAVRARKAALNILPPHEEVEKGRRLAALAKSVAASEQLLLETSSAAIELSRGVPRSIFAEDGKIDIFIPQHPRYSLKYREELCAAVPELEGRLSEHRYPLNPSADELPGLLSDCGDRVVFVSFRAPINRGQLGLAEKLKAVSKKNLLIAADIPYDLDRIPDWDNAVAVCDPSDLAVRAFARLMKKQLAALREPRCSCHHD